MGTRNKTMYKWASKNNEELMESETIGAAQSIDFSLVALFLRATLTVKIVMLISFVLLLMNLV